MGLTYPRERGRLALWGIPNLLAMVQLCHTCLSFFPKPLRKNSTCFELPFDGMNHQAHKIKHLYTEGHSVTDIATTLGISRPSVYYHLNNAKARGEDWDGIRYANAMDGECTEQSEKAFLSTLIQSFEKELQHIEEIADTDKRLVILAKYATLYYKIKQPLTGDSRSHRLSGAIESLYAVGKIASAKNEMTVVQFLATHHDEIIASVNQAKKSP